VLRCRVRTAHYLSRIYYTEIFKCSSRLLNTLRTGDADLRLYTYKQFKYAVPN
jgi:hypothetical protein